MNKNELKVEAKELYENGTQFLKNAGLLKPPRHITAEYYVADGEPRYKFRCHVCGNEWSVENADACSSRRYAQNLGAMCLKCGCYVELRAALKKSRCPKTRPSWTPAVNRRLAR